MKEGAGFYYSFDFVNHTSNFNISKNLHCMKSVRIQSYSGPYFPDFGLNTERYGVSLRIFSSATSSIKSHELVIDQNNKLSNLKLSRQLIQQLFLKGKLSNTFVLEDDFNRIVDLQLFVRLCWTTNFDVWKKVKFQLQKQPPEVFYKKKCS